MAGNAESNGHGPALVMVPFGPAEDDFVTLAVASKMLAGLLDRDDKLFTVLLGEAMTGVRLAKVLARRDSPELAELATQGSG